MKRRSRVTSMSMSIVALAIVGCGMPQRPAPPSLDEAELAPLEMEVASSVVDDLLDDNKRLANLEYALTTTSARRCGALARPQSGMLLSRDDFFEDRVMRDTARRMYDLDRDVRVMYVVPGSRADEAGIREGDEILEVDGEALVDSARFRAHLLGRSDRTSIAITLERAGERIDEVVDFEPGCPVVFKISDEFKMIARAPQRLMVRVPRGVLHLAGNDDVLAVVLAHELAHTCFDDDSRPWAEQEARADRTGLIIAAQAGYDVRGTVAYWERVAREYPWLIDAAPESKAPLRRGFGLFSHYGIGSRMAGIRSTIAEIDARIAAGQESP